MRREIEQVFLLLARRRQALEIGFVDDDVAGGAGHCPLASALERLFCVPGDVEQTFAEFGRHFLVECAVGLEESHQGQAAAPSRPGIAACAGMTDWARAAASMHR